MKKITILLTKYSDTISWIVYNIGGKGFTHASIKLEDDTNYYSFNYYGFCIETSEKHKKRGIKKCLTYELQVPYESFRCMKERIEEIKTERYKYKYTKLGLLFAIFNIPFHWKYHYFCSQFVAELLKEYGKVPLKKNANVFLPNHFCSELENCRFFDSLCHDFL